MGIILPLLISETGLSEHDVVRIISNAPVRYKTYLIPKRNGDARTISQPARELKILQRILTEKILSGRPVHAAATAYRVGVSIKANAIAHVQNGPILKMDFKDFFPSITDKDWRSYCEKHSLFADAEDIRITTNILFRRDRGSQFLRLAIGAPSSPSLSNLLMYDFDTKIFDLVAQDQVTYTRYADDVTFSARRTGFLTKVRGLLERAIRETPFPSLKINEAKTVLATQKYKRMVTGLILTNERKVSIGSRRKRQIRAAVHHQTLGRLNIVAQARLAGMLAFVNDVEPEFLNVLKHKYGEAVIAELRSIRLSQRIPQS
jgi:RNA-directed DNA polymerase